MQYPDANSLGRFFSMTVYGIPVLSLLMFALGGAVLTLVALKYGTRIETLFKPSDRTQLPDAKEYARGEEAPLAPNLDGDGSYPKTIKEALRIKLIQAVMNTQFTLKNPRITVRSENGELDVDVPDGEIGELVPVEEERPPPPPPLPTEEDGS